MSCAYRKIKIDEDAIKHVTTYKIIRHETIIALKASGRDCTNNNELLHKIGVLQRYAMQ